MIHTYIFSAGNNWIAVPSERSVDTQGKAVIIFPRGTFICKVYREKKQNDAMLPYHIGRAKTKMLYGTCDAYRLWCPPRLVRMTVLTQAQGYITNSTKRTPPPAPSPRARFP